MRLLLATVVVAAAGAQRGATPTGHALLLGTQRTGTTWAMAELAKSPCASTTSELFIQFKWERGARMACLRMLYGDVDARDRSLRQKCSAKFRGFLDKSRGADGQGPGPRGKKRPGVRVELPRPTAREGHREHARAPRGGGRRRRRLRRSTVESASTALSTPSSHKFSRSSARPRACGSRDAAAPLNLFVYVRWE